MRRLLRRVRRSELGGLAQDTGFVAFWQASTAAAMLVQIVLITHTFGISEYGRFAVVVAIVDLVGGCFNLRVSYAATTFGARWLANDARVAVGVFQYSFIIDLATTFAAVLLLVVLAFVAGTQLVGAGSTDLILVFAFSLIGPALSRASFVILRLLDRFALIATYQWVLELGRVALILLAIWLFDSLFAVVVAVTVALLAAGAINIAVAARVFCRAHDLRLTQPHLSKLERTERRAILKMMFHTLTISYSQVVQKQLPTVLLGAIAGTAQTGLYKIGMAAATILGQLIAPATNALLPRLARLWTAGRVTELRRLVARASVISAAAMGVAFATVVVFQDPILRLLGGGPQGEAASTVLLLGAASQALYGLVFWRSVLLYAADRTGAMSVVYVSGAGVHILTMLILVPTYGASGAALAALISQVIVSVWLTSVALRTLRSAPDSSTDAPAAAPAATG